MMQNLFFLVNHLWQSTLVASVAWLTCRTVLRNNHPRVRFGIWLAATVKFLIPFALLVEAGHWLGKRPAITAAQSQQIFDLVRGGGTGLITGPFRASSAPQDAIAWQNMLLAALLIAWGMGAGVILFRWMRSWQAIRQVVRTAVPSGGFQGIPVLKSAEMREQQIEPGIFGIWRQTIVIPEGMESVLSDAQFQTVLSHEWNHATWNDNLTSTLQMMAEVIFWFYPVIWMLGRRLTEERELACDQAVLEQASSENCAEAYAEGILKVCKLYRSSSLACVAGVTGANLRARVELILRNQRPVKLSNVKRWALAAAVLAASAGPAVMGFLTAPAASAQQGNSFQGLATSAEKKFEVATVRLNQTGSDEWRLGPPGRGSITVMNYALRNLVVQAFRTQRDMVLGVPSWADSEKYDITAKGPDPNAANPEVWEMMRSLLIERFHLKYHLDKREMPVFALTVGPKGHKLELGENGRCAEDIKAGKNCGDLMASRFGAGIYNMPIGALITSIGVKAGRPIIDKTGLTGRYDINITFLPEGVKLEDLDLQNVPPQNRPQDVTIFEALEQQAELKLVSQKAEMPVVVIDSLSRPDPN